MSAESAQSVHSPADCRYYLIGALLRVYELVVNLGSRAWEFDGTINTYGDPRIGIDLPAEDCIVSTLQGWVELSACFLGEETGVLVHYLVDTLVVVCSRSLYSFGVR